VHRLVLQHLEHDHLECALDDFATALVPHPLLSFRLG
jgi:hypothetical protein